MKKNHLITILSFLIVKFMMSKQSKVYTFCYLREYISFTTKMTLETWASLLLVGRKIYTHTRKFEEEKKMKRSVMRFWYLS